MRRADTGQTPWHNLAALGHKLPEYPVVLVINGVNFLSAKLADFLAPEEFAPTFTTTARSTGTWSTPVAPTVGS